MQKLGFPSMKSFDQFKSLSGSAKKISFSSRPSSDSISSGSFSNLKLTAEKLIKDQASIKTDLEIANSKLKKSTELIATLEEKLQNAFNENAKLKVKQKEDEKLWKGLESKFSSTKTLCDQLTETLQLLASQVHNAEKDMEFFESKLSASSNAVDGLNQQLNGLSLKLGSAEETIRTCEQELEELRIEKEERNKIFTEEQSRMANLIAEKDAMIKKFEATVETSKLEIESLNSKLEETHLEVGLKKDEIKHLIVTQENLEKERSDLQFSRNDLATKFAASLQDIKNLESVVHISAEQLAELDKQNFSFVEKFDQLDSLYDTCFKLVQQERDLSAKHARIQYDQMHDKFLSMRSEKDALLLVNQELNDKVIQLQKDQTNIKAYFSEECRLAEETIRRIEFEAEMLLSKKNEMEVVISELEKRIEALTESSKSSENKTQDLLLKISTLEIENKDIAEKLAAEVRKNAEEVVTWQEQSEKQVQHADSLEKQVAQLNIMLEEKEQLLLQYKDGVKKLEDKITESQASLAAAESKFSEAKSQYDLMLESKQLELSRHLKEISQRNDQAVNDIRKKYEFEKLEIIKVEKEKTDKIILETERKCEEKVAECKEESRRQLLCIQDEHAALVLHMKQENDRKEMNLKADHIEELKRVQIQSENDLRERTMQLRNEHEVQLKVLKCQNEDECRRLQEELDLQKSKEERQKALLQMQWRVMSDKPQDDQEVTSKKDYSFSSIQMRDSGGGKRSQHVPVRSENIQKDLPFLGETQSPVSKRLSRAENANTGSVMSIPQHHKKVTRHEYEVETANGRTITKRRKTKSTVMFEDPRKHKKMNTPKTRTPRSGVKAITPRSVVKAITPRSAVKGIKGGYSHPSNIGDLFSEGSLNPYADDPYAFD